MAVACGSRTLVVGERSYDVYLFEKTLYLAGRPLGSASGFCRGGKGIRLGAVRNTCMYWLPW